MAYEISELDRKHANIMERMAVICRSYGGQFTDETRLNVIAELLEGTAYSNISNGNLYRMYGKIPVDKLPDACILVSAHVDTVQSIQSCHSTLDEETGVYTGTYDNAGPDAVEVVLMQEEELPENIVFAFTGDEETGCCKGAKEAAACLIRAGKHPFCIALDVTYEGYDDNFLISVENLVPTPDSYAEPKILKKIGELLIGLEPEKTQTFRLVAKGESHIPKNLSDKYVADDFGMVDEAFAYAEMMCPTMSLCLPCGNGGMHSQTGVKVKAPVLEGYILSLSSILYKMSDYVKNILYGKDDPVSEHHTEKINAYKIARGNLVGMAAEICMPKREPVRFYDSVSDYYRTNGYAYNKTVYRKSDSLLETYDFDEEDLRTLATDAENWGDKEDFLQYATFPRGIFETLGIDPEDECTKEQEELFLSLKEEIWECYEEGMLRTLDEDDYEDDYYEEDEPASSNQKYYKEWSDFQNDMSANMWAEDFDYN